MDYLLRHCGLIFELTKREFSNRYQQSFIGIFWSFIQPLFLLTVYTVAFGVILKARWGFAGSTLDYALILFAGLIVLNSFTEVFTKAPTLILNNPNFVKKLVFPIELLPIVTVLVSLMNALIGILILLIGYTILIGTPQQTVLMIPVIFGCFVPVLIGFGWLLSALGVFIRDLSPLTALLSHALLFLTPIFYSIEAAPIFLRKLLLLNPLTFIVEQVRLTLFYGQIPSLKSLAIYFVLASIFAFISLLIFRKLRINFADMV